MSNCYGLLELYDITIINSVAKYTGIIDLVVNSYSVFLLCGLTIDRREIDR